MTHPSPPTPLTNRPGREEGGKRSPAARFSILHDALVRVEWAPDGRFVDEPSILAAVPIHLPGIYKRPRPIETLVVRDDQLGTYTLETCSLKLEYTPSAAPPGWIAERADGASPARTFHPDTLRVLIKKVENPLPARGGRGWAGFGSGTDTTSNDVDPSTFSIWRPGLRDTRNLGGALESLDGLKGAPTSGVIAHGLLSRSGWHLVDDAHSALRVGDWVTSRAALGYADRAPSPDGRARVDAYLFAYADDYRAAFDALWALSGPPELPPRAMLGSWFSRYWPYTSDDFRAIVDDYERHGFPLDILVMDMDWHSAAARPGRGGGRWTGWSWNRDLLPDAERLIDDLHARGIQVTLNLHPSLGVHPDEERYAAFMRALGRDPNRGEVVPFDAGDRAYMHALFQEVIAPLERESSIGTALTPRGVDFWWLDWQQERYVRSIPPPGLTNLQWLNELFYRHSRGKLLPEVDVPNVHPADDAPPPRRGRSFSRWAGLGDHRHPMHFSGDAHSGWEMLAFQVAFTLASANSACFFWSHDIGGHYGWRDEEAMTRWTQFGAFSAALRLHSARHAELDRRPWLCAEPFASAMRRAFALRARLMPTIASQAASTIRRGTAFLRPMYHDFPSCERAYASPAQYFIGDALLVAPIVEPAANSDVGVVTREIWIPQSLAHRFEETLGDERPEDCLPVEWVRLDTGERYSVSALREPHEHSPTGLEAPSQREGVGGGRDAERSDAGSSSDQGLVALVSAAIDEVPVFCRAGAPVFMQSPGPRMAGTVGVSRSDEDVQTLIVRLFPGRDQESASARLTETDGESQVSYVRVSAAEVWAWWSVDADGATQVSLKLSEMRGSYPGQRPRRRWIIEIGGVRDLRVESIRTEGVSLDPEFLAKWEAERDEAEIDPIESMRLGDEPIAPNGPNAPAHSEAGQHGVLRRIALTPMSIRESLNMTLSMSLIDQRAHDAQVRAARARRMLRSVPVHIHKPRPTSSSQAANFAPDEADRTDRALRAAAEATDPDSLAFAEQYARVLRVASGIGVCVRTPGPCAEPESGRSEVVLVVPPDLGLDADHARVETIDACGCVEEVVEDRVVSLNAVGNASLEHVGLELDEPPVGLVRRRVARVTLRQRSHAAPADFTFAQELARRVRPLRHWRVAGPFGWDWTRSIAEQVHWPEQDLARTERAIEHDDDASRALGGNWRPGTAGPVWALDFGRMFATRHADGDTPGKGLAYARTRLFSPRSQRVFVRVRSADKLEAWVNGEHVFRIDDFASDAARRGAFACDLRAGVNSLLIKCPDGWGDWGLTVTLEAEHALSELDWPVGEHPAARHPHAG